MPKQQSKSDSHLQQSSSLLQAYKRALLWRKIMLGAFGVIFAAILFWIIPWFPYGLETHDYNERITWLLALVGAAGITAFGSIYHRDASRRVEQTILTWSTVHDGLGDARKREYFYDRLVLQCDRARSERSEFTVVALRLDDPTSDEVKDMQNSEKALRILAPTAEESNCLAILGPHEIGILAPNADSKHAHAFAERLRSLVAMTAEATLQVRVGWAVYPQDAEDAGSLLGLSRERLLGRKSGEVVTMPVKESEDETDYQAVA